MTLSNVSEALKVYDDLRRPFAQEIWRRSQTNGYLYHLRRLGWEHVTSEQSASGDYPRELLGKLGEELENAVGWAMNGSILEDRDRVVNLLDKL